jgi:hypothetical protein
VVQSGGAAFDAEVIRVLKKDAEKWKPALKNWPAVACAVYATSSFMAVEE